MNKFKHIPVLFFAGSNGSPDTIAPSHASVAASTLCYPAVDNGMADFLLSTIVGRFNSRFCQKAEVIFRIIQGLKQLFEPVQQFIAPAGQFQNAHLSQKLDLPDQMSHTILDYDISKPGELAICSKKVAHNGTSEILAQNIEQNLASSGFVYMIKTEPSALKTPYPALETIVFAAGLINAYKWLFRQAPGKLIVRSFQRIQTLLIFLQSKPLETFRFMISLKNC